jgi:23S rRNA pseudouridine1911/1915/1917 synthase
MAENRIFTVGDDSVGLRLDKYLVAQMPEFSRNEIQRFIVSRNGVPARCSEKVKSGDKIIVEIQDTPTIVATDNISDELDLEILYQDDDIIVVNKPRGVVMYPSAGNKTGTLVQNILSFTHLSALGGETRPGVVHRLDKDTSGIVVLAKSDAAYRALIKTFAAHDLTRKYVAFVWGIPNWTNADITGNIARSSRNRQKMSMVKSGGKPAHTIVDVLDVWPRAGVSEFLCTLMTGRTHQIRVHLSAHGFPVLCDPVYGHGSSRLGAVRNPDLLDFIKTHSGQMLHAKILEFAHPITGKMMKFKTDLPDDMLELKAILDNR